ncbi:MAG: sugar MFS transporter [Bacteroidaceae bacterium]|nr:sugar MFS transporter [Bacteroidaceae bacterium]
MRTIEKKYLLPFILVTSLFALWGLANNMTDTLLAAFRKIMQMNDTQTSLIQMAFYGAYFCLALPAALFIRKYNFKGGIILGLCLYATGAMLFLPAAEVESYAFYLLAIYIMAAGCSVLETTANPYIMSMGSPETATRRLNIAQSFNPVGSIVGILISKYFILQDISLYSVSGTYAAVGGVLIAIMAAMFFAKMPKGSDNSKVQEVQELKSSEIILNSQLALAPSIFYSLRRLLSNRVYTGGVIAQFFYVGAQIGVWSFTIRLVMKELGMTEAEAATLYLISIIGFCTSRFVYTWIMKYIAPQRLLVAGAVLSTICTLLVVLTNNWLCVVSLILISVFMSLMFPTIYGIALESVAKSKYPDDTKIGASGLIMAILGGALLTPLQGMVSDAVGINLSYLVPMGCFLVVFIFALNSRQPSKGLNT